MKHFYIILIFIIFILSGCFNKNINEMPLYGGIQKTKKQIDADIKFINESIRIAGSRKKAASELANNSWDAFYRNDFKLAIKRFNQAWLLDPENMEVYWGLGIILDRQKKMIPNTNFYIRIGPPPCLWNKNTRSLMKNSNLQKTLAEKQ
jgi:hypothetical protein